MDPLSTFTFPLVRAGNAGDRGKRPPYRGTKKPHLLFSQEMGRKTGDVLLSHKLYMHYHRGCSVSLPCSEWERVGPLRWDHQKSDEFEATLRLIWEVSHWGV